MPDAAPSQQRRIVRLLTGLLTFLLFIPALRNQFINWDDDKNFLANLNYRGLAWPHLKWMFTTFHQGHYMPLTWMTFGADYLLWGMNPAGYHLTNILLHALNAVLFFGLSVRVLSLASGRPEPEEDRSLTWAAFFAALFFALHPLRVESVAWATERRDVLSACFLLLTVREYFLYCAETKNTRRLFFICLGWFALSLLSKSIGMVLPAVLLVLDIYPLRRLKANPAQWIGAEARSVWLEKIPFALAAVAAMIIAARAQTSAGAAISWQDYSIYHRAAQTCYGAAYYLAMTVAPFGLSSVEIPDGFNPFQPLYLACAAFVVLTTILLFRRRQRWPAGLAAWTVYLIFIAPTSGIFQSGPQFVADRYSYLSCMPWAIVAGGGFLWITNNRPGSGRMMIACCAAWLVGLSIATLKQITVWRTSETFWTHNVALQPRSPLAHYSIAKIFSEQQRWPEAEEQYLTALEYRPTLVPALYNLASMYYQAGQWPKAENYFRRAVAEKPDYTEAHNNLGFVLLKEGKRDEAVAEFETALRLNPDSELIRKNLKKATEPSFRRKPESIK